MQFKIELYEFKKYIDSLPRDLKKEFKILVGHYKPIEEGQEMENMFYNHNIDDKVILSCKDINKVLKKYNDRVKCKV